MDKKRGIFSEMFEGVKMRGKQDRVKDKDCF